MKEDKERHSEDILVATECVDDEVDKSSSATSSSKGACLDPIKGDATTFADTEDAEMGPEKDPEKDPEKVDEKGWSNMKISTSQAQEEESNGDEYLIEDSYSLMFVSSYTSLSFLYAAASIFVQMAITAALLWDLFIKSGEDGNPIGVPPDVPPSVRMVAFLTLLAVPGFMEDFVTAVSFLSQGYDNRVQLQKPHATFVKFLLAGILQLLTGLGLLCTIFALIVKSETVVGLMLNYAALHFVSEIDNLAFRMAKEGFITSNIQQETQDLKNVKFSNVAKRTLTVRRVAYVLACGCLLSGYIRIARKQDSGEYLCQKLFLQLGDGFNHGAAAFSGVYQQDGKASGLNSRVIYAGPGPLDYVKLAFCKDDSTWSLLASSDVSKPFDPCSTDWVLKSSPTDGYDITEVADLPWFISIDERRVEVIDHFIMKCVDCDKNPIAGRACSGSGTCIDNTCVCDEGYAGLQCEFESPCEKLIVDYRRPMFPGSVNEDRLGGDDGGRVFGSYLLLRRNDTNASYVEVYNRPVYVEYQDDESESASLLLYLGRRWVVTRDYNNDLLIDLAESIHGVYNPPNISYVSEAVDQGTQDDSLSPVGLEWYQPEGNTLEGLLGRADASQPIETRFVCGVCDGSADEAHNSSNPCFRGECQKELDYPKCACGNSVTIPTSGILYQGSLCEEAAQYETFFYPQRENATSRRFEVDFALWGKRLYYELEDGSWYRWRPDYNGKRYRVTSFPFSISS